MRVLLDTHALLWWLFDDPQLPERPRQLISDRSNEVLVSSASAWEVCTKHRLGKLPAAAQLADDFVSWILRAGFVELPVSIRHAQHAGNWPQAHRDPFDRMLAAQSHLESLPLISRDPALKMFGIQLIW